MARSGRFGKYGDLKRKEQIRSVKLSRSGQAKTSLAVAEAMRKDRSLKSHKKK